ncbi:fluoride efflux transporter CrcB [Actinotalea ferrariae]|uniref:fluoride efflux transporter CrcB n=1 Tax=Actinotalea ferrariae TaxID=1386098 RepID=UPI001C8B70BC|nr:fluoride efflux transporter CrcB [Actinotalea ferrariae]MBX9245461.1 fluoride efflux transporter CrcB [Actinotalea ferrariae]
MIAVLVVVGGGLGAATRFLLDGWVRERRPGPFPLGTFLVNVSGSLLIGVLSGAVAFHALPTDVYAVAAVGFCGGYTTFSTAMVETVRLVQAGDVGRAVGTAVGSLLVTLGAAALGVGLMAAIA